MSTPIKKTCTVCHKQHTPEEWFQLKHVGNQRAPGIELEMRDCTCGTTLAVVLWEEKEWVAA